MHFFSLLFGMYKKKSPIVWSVYISQAMFYLDISSLNSLYGSLNIRGVFLSGVCESLYGESILKIKRDNVLYRL